MNEDEVSELDKENRILRAPDEREANRIIPNPTLKVQPIFIDPGPSTKPVKGKKSNKGPPSGLCLEISGRVQRDTNELKHFMIDDQLVTEANDGIWHKPSANGGSGFADNTECSLDYN